MGSLFGWLPDVPVSCIRGQASIVRNTSWHTVETTYCQGTGFRWSFTYEGALAFRPLVSARGQTWLTDNYRLANPNDALRKLREDKRGWTELP